MQENTSNKNFTPAKPKEGKHTHTHTESYRDTVRSTNEYFTGVSDFLSNSLYLYKRETEQIEIA